MKDVYARGDSLAQKFYKERIFPLLEQLWRAEGQSVHERALAFWRGKDLKPDDWLGLLKWNLAKVFSNSFLEP